MIKNIDDLKQAIETLLASPVLQRQALSEEDGDYINPYDLAVFEGINDTRQDSRPIYMAGKCGQTSHVFEEYFQDYHPEVEVSKVTSDEQGSVFHVYNIIELPDGTSCIFDGSAAQFFSDPMEAFNGTPYFLGSKDELKKITEEKQKTTWRLLQSFQLSETFNNLADADAKMDRDWDLSQEVVKAFKAVSGQSYLRTELLDKGWQTTWGDVARTLGRR